MDDHDALLTPGRCVQFCQKKLPRRTRQRALLAVLVLVISVILSACAPPLVPYSVDTPPLVLVPTSVAGVEDKRGRFRLSGTANNARQIRDAIMQMELEGTEPRLVLIGYSKGAPDILEAVVSYPEIRPRVAAVGGSPLANDADQSQLALLQHWPGLRPIRSQARCRITRW
jgi:hypothetical protein